MKQFIKDSAEFSTRNFTEMLDFLTKREQKNNYKWLTDEDGIAASDIHFYPIVPEPIMAPCHMTELQRKSAASFGASEESFMDSMYCPSVGLEGSSQVIEVDGRLYPAGRSAIRGILERAGVKIEGYKKLMEYDPQELSSVLNSFFKASKGGVCLLIQDEKVRAVNSDRYGICPISFVAKTTQAWINNNYPDAEVTSAYTNHDFSAWTIDLIDYTDDIFSGADQLKQLGFTPAIIVQSSNTLSSSVMIKPCIVKGGVVFPVGKPIACPHIGKGDASSRSLQIKETVLANFALAYSSVSNTVAEIQNLEKITVRNAYNALLRAMKAVGMPKMQGMEAAEIFEQVHYGKPATALECYLAVVDAYSFVVRDNPNDIKKQFEVGECVTKCMRIDWEKLGKIPGSFSW
mgnify:CR=1 FL=1